MAKSLSMYSITENIYCSQLSSFAILLQSEPVSHRIIQGQDWVLSPYMLSSCGLPLPPTCLLVTVNEARSYFPSTIIVVFADASRMWTLLHSHAVCDSSTLLCSALMYKQASATNSVFKAKIYANVKGLMTSLQF
jgi:hypothetical protein